MRSPSLSRERAREREKRERGGGGGGGRRKGGRERGRGRETHEIVQDKCIMSNDNIKKGERGGGTTQYRVKNKIPGKK